MAKSKELKNKFRCMSCDEERLRGNWVKIEKGSYKGTGVKVCQSQACIDAAKKGQFGVTR